MRPPWKARVAQRIPSLRRRDELLAERTSQLSVARSQARELRSLVRELQSKAERTERAERAFSQARADVARARDAERITPSYRQQYFDLSRQARRATAIDPEGRHPYRQLKLKLRNYRFAQSHGVGTPEILAVWPTVDDIDLSDLPETFVLKSDLGSHNRGVLLLRRLPSEGFQSLDGLNLFTRDEIRGHFASQLPFRRVGGPFFAEELLIPPEGGLLPVDVKISAFYGEIAHVLLRRVTHPQGMDGPAVAAYKFVDACGDDLGRIRQTNRLDAGIPPPANLADMLAQARHLSRALGVPGCRVDLYNTTRGIVLGELTLTPGGPQEYLPEHDAQLGAVWRDAVLRRDLDLVDGRPFGLLHGPHTGTNYYPPDHLSRYGDPGPWTLREAHCEEWCGIAND